MASKRSFNKQVLLFIFFCLLFSLRPLDDFDIYGQIAIGRFALDNGYLLSEEPLLYSFTQSSWVNPGWLWQLGSALFIEQFGISMFRYLHIFLLASTVLLASGFFSEREKKIVFEPYALALIPLLSSISVRPQIIAFFLFALTILVLSKVRATWLRDISLFIAFILWQNCHPSLLVALPIIVFTPSERSSLFQHLLERSRLVLLCLIATVLTPLGTGVYELSGKNLIIARELFSITEWYSYFELPFSFLPTFGISLLLSSAILFLKRKHLSWGELLIFATYSIATLFAVRFVAFWSFATLPLLLKACDTFEFERLPLSKIATLPPVVKNLSLCILLASLLYANFHISLFSKSFPITCINALESYKPKRIFNYYLWGGLIAYETRSNQNIIADGRLYLRSEKWWRNYQQLLNGDSEERETIMSEYEPDAFILSSKESTKLIQALRAESDWSEESFSSEDCSLFVHSSIS